MTATTVQSVAVATKDKPKLWRCGFCAQGHHGSCPGAVWHRRRVGDTERTEPILWRCRCEEPGHPNFPYCTECKNDHVDEVHPELWRCLDSAGCAARIQARHNNSELWQMLQRVKSASALKRKAERLNQEELLSGLDPDQDAAIERMHAYLDGLDEAKKKRRGKARVGPPKPKVGACECCGEPTRGGRFLPGHDARLASALVTRIRDNGDPEAYAEMERRGWGKKIPAALRKAN